MSFDKGPMTFRVCRLMDDLPEDVLDRFAELCAPALDQIRDEPVIGWVSGRHLLETRIDSETSQLGNFYHLCLRQAERKIPAPLMNAECKMAELAAMAAKGVDHLKRQEKQEIKQEIKERMLPNMPPQLSGIPVSVDLAEKLVYVGATTERQLDLFLDFFRKATGVEPVPVTPDFLAQEILGTDATEIPALNISPELPDDAQGGSIGENFLTWLWYFQEERGGVLPPSRLGEFALMIDGPLVLAAEGGGALESAIRKGTPTISAEAKAALMVGKKLRSAKVLLARGKGEEWSVTMDAREFVFRSLKVPEGEAMEAVSIFEDRMTNLNIFLCVIRALFQLYLKEMTDPAKAADYQAKAKEWVKNRRGE